MSVFFRILHYTFYALTLEERRVGDGFHVILLQHACVSLTLVPSGNRRTGVGHE